MNELDQFLKSSFDTNTTLQNDLQGRIQLLEKSNEATQIESAKQFLKDNAYLNHMVKVVSQLIENYESDDEKKEQLINYQAKQIDEYERRHGKLDSKLLEKLRYESSLVSLNSSSRKSQMLSKLQAANKQVLSRIK